MASAEREPITGIWGRTCEAHAVWGAPAQGVRGKAAKPHEAASLEGDYKAELTGICNRSNII